MKNLRSICLKQQTCLALAAFFVTALLGNRVYSDGSNPPAVDSVVQEFASYDLDGDGILEINQLAIIDGLNGEIDLKHPQVLVVMIESRLLQDSSDRTSDGLMDRFVQYRKSLIRDGWSPIFISADLYSGARHQDGRTVLALRRFFQSLKSKSPGFAGAVLIGSFPESMLVRRWAWKRRNRPVKFAGVTYNRGSGPKATIISMNPELISHRSDVVLCDLDGNWEEIYIQPKTKIDSIRFMPGTSDDELWPTDDVAITTERFTVRQKSFEDFFFIDDVQYEFSNRSDDLLEVRGSYSMKRPEVSRADLESPNPIAMPEIMVSRINPLHVAVSQPVKNLDHQGIPKVVPKSNGSPNRQFYRDSELERQLLVEYFDRNLAHRRGIAVDRSKSVAVLTTDLQTPSKRYFSDVSKQLGGVHEFSKATTVDFVRFMKSPAIIKGVSAHSNPTLSVLTKGYSQTELSAESGGGYWFWAPKGENYVPTYNHKSIRNNVHFSLLRTLWANKKLKDSGASFYIHGGCEAISPVGAARYPYNSKRYGGHGQIAENLLFYGNGLALIGRSKVYFDIPSGFNQSFGVDRGRFGDILTGYFANDSRNARLGRSVASRNKAYFWSVIGDWTLKLNYPDTRGDDDQNRPDIGSKDTIR